MIEYDEKLLFISQANLIAIIKQNESFITGFIEKKIVVTTRRCLVFQSLSNKVQEIQYQVVSKRQRPKQSNFTKRSKLSINEAPQFWFPATQRQVKVVIDEQPTILKYFQKQGIKNLMKTTTGMVILKNPKKQKFEILLFPSLKDAFRFAKGLMCAKSWIEYEKYCMAQQYGINLQWVRILQEIVSHQNSLTLIDPDLFVEGTNQEIQSFLILIKNISFAHSFQLRYSIVNEQSIFYTTDFLKSLQEKIHQLIMSGNNLKPENLSKILNTGLKMRQLMKLNLQKNELNDQCFTTFQLLARQNKKLSYINLSHNKITFSNFSYFLEFLKTTPVILNLNLSYNQITDKAIDNIQKFILFSLNPPIEEIQMNFNQFTPKGSWRLYVGYLKNFKNHVYLNFIIYPIPFKKQIFYEQEIDFPRKQSKQTNFNMHSALVEEFQQQSIMRHTMQDIIIKPETIGIRFIRQLLPGVRLPKNKQQVSKTLQLSNKIQNFIYTVQSVQKIYTLAHEMKTFNFEIPPRTRNNFIKFLNKRLNEALLIRDHYSIKYILKSLKQLQIPHQGYSERLKRVENRDSILCKRLENILEYKFQQVNLNKEIDEVVKQSLRLYLQGKGVQLLYYLKFYRDQLIQKLLGDKYNPEHQIYGKMALKNLSVEQKVSSKDFLIPYQIKIQKKINQNFYLHPWQTNYLVLCEMETRAFVECLEFLEESEKRETFAKYFERIEQRVQFIKNEFTLFTYKQFKISYMDLKVNACRLLFLYKNIQDTHFFLQIPIYIKKKPITCQKPLYINNPENFLKKYHIIHYPNINAQAKKQMFYNYKQIITRYQSQTFQVEARRTLKLLNEILNILQINIYKKNPREDMIGQILPLLKDLIDLVRHSIYPQEIKEQIYLHLIGWRKGRYGKNIEVIEIIPWLTMYIKPPLQIEKYLVAAVLEAKQAEVNKYSLCLVSDMNRPTPEDIHRLDSQFVERDWTHYDNIISELILNNGKLFIEIHLLDKKKIGVMVSESMTISQLMSYLLGFHELNCEDRQCFWLYKLDKEAQQTVPLTGSDYVGEIIAIMNIETELLICRRRIFPRELKYVYSRYGEAIIDSLYAQMKFQYMMRGLFDSDKSVYEISSLIFIIDNIQNYELLKKKDPRLKDKKVDHFILEQVNRIQSIFSSYIPRQIMTRIMKTKDMIFNQIKAKVSERMLKKQHYAIYEMKTSLLRHFQHFPQFCSTNYKMVDKNSNDLKVYINCMYIYVESQTQKQYIKLEKIISIIPKAKYILISYHKNENIVGQLPLFSQEINIIGAAMDLLSYCLMRLKMVSNNLYEISRYERIQTQIQQIQRSLKKVYSKDMELKLFQNRKQKQNIEIKIMKMSLTVMDLKQLIYYKQSHYIKSFLDRKLYANKSQKKMSFSQQSDEQQKKETYKWKKNVFGVIFPQYVAGGFGRKGGAHQQQQVDEFNIDGEFNQDSEYDLSFYASQHPNNTGAKQLARLSNGQKQIELQKQQAQKQKQKQKKSDKQPPTQRKVDNREQQRARVAEEFEETAKKQDYASNKQDHAPNKQEYTSNKQEYIPNKQENQGNVQKQLPSPKKIQKIEQKMPPLKPINEEIKGKVEVQPPQSIKSEDNQEEEAVYGNKKPGRNNPPRRRQR